MADPPPKKHDHSFFHTDTIICPVCQESLKREVMRFGQGRLISIDINDELKQNYKANKKFGEIYPFIYNVLICHNCWFAALSEDFQKKNFFDTAELKKESKFRIQQGREIYARCEFDEYRTLHTGLVGYFLAILCYTHCLHKHYAHAKKAIAALRASWCAFELFANENDESYLALKQYLRYTCLIESNYHVQGIYSVQKKKNTMAVELYGPDVNKDMGFDGFLYLNSYLNLEFLSLEPSPEHRKAFLEKSRNTLSKVFGFGQTSKQKPSVLSNKARSLYQNIKDKLAAMEDVGTI